MNYFDVSKYGQKAKQAVHYAQNVLGSYADGLKSYANDLAPKLKLPYLPLRTHADTYRGSEFVAPDNYFTFMSESLDAFKKAMGIKKPA
jgi:hypothetical protein